VPANRLEGIIVSWLADLAPMPLMPTNCGALRAVGWLEAGQPFPTGRVEPAVFERLSEFARDPWEPFASLGVHPCDLCQYEPIAHGARNIFIPGHQILYVCPELITHYMNAHGYRPPDEFCNAVLRCSPMRSRAYLEAILANGGRPLVRSRP